MHHRLAPALILSLLACLTASPATAQGNEPAASPTRPHDPWVFRCVLDEQPRMIVIALADNLWLAYDGIACSLSKTMARPIKFDGAVHTGGHGPQPTSRPPYHEAHTPDAVGWTITDSQGATHALHLLGYSLDGQQSVTLRYGLHPTSDGNAPDLLIEESPEAKPGESPAWRRTIRITGLPEGWTITQQLGRLDQGTRTLLIDDAASPIGGDDLDATNLQTYHILTRYLNEPPSISE